MKFVKRIFDIAKKSTLINPENRCNFQYFAQSKIVLQRSKSIKQKIDCVNMSYLQSIYEITFFIISTVRVDIQENSDIIRVWPYYYVSGAPNRGTSVWEAGPG